MNHFPPPPTDSDDIDFSSLLDCPEAAAAIFLDEKRARAGGATAAATAASGEKYVVFGLGGELYAVHSRLVAEVLSTLPVTTLPGVPAWLAGVTNLRGEIICVVDLREFWQKPVQPATALDSHSKHKLIVLHSAKNDLTAAFLVERFYEIVTLAPHDVKFSAADFENSFPTLFGKATHKSETLHLFDAENLLLSLALSEPPSATRTR